MFLKNFSDYFEFLGWGAMMGWNFSMGRKFLNLEKISVPPQLKMDLSPSSGGVGRAIGTWVSQKNDILSITNVFNSQKELPEAWVPLFLFFCTILDLRQDYGYQFQKPSV